MSDTLLERPPELSRAAAWAPVLGFAPDLWRGDVLRSCRVSQGLTREYVAHLLGRCARTVDRWESGETSPAPSEVLVLAALLRTAHSAFYRPRDTVRAEAV